jgi:hypothetical protein
MMGVPYFSALISTPSNGRLVLYPSLLSHRKKRLNLGNDMEVGPKPCGANANYTNMTNLMRIFNIFREIGFAKGSFI